MLDAMGLLCKSKILQIKFYIFYAGYSFTGSGDWVLQDGTFSFADLTSIFKQPDVELALKEQKGILHLYFLRCLFLVI